MSDWAGEGDGSDALDELARWLRDAVARTGLTHEALAGRLWRDRTAISQAMLGLMLPPLPLTEAIAEGCGTDTMTARRLWAAAREPGRQALLAGTILVSSGTSRPRTTGTWAIARTAAASCGGSVGMSVGITHPLYGVLAITLTLFATIAILVLAVCLSDKHSERLYRWGRLILGREEPQSLPGAYEATRNQTLRPIGDLPGTTRPGPDGHFADLPADVPGSDIVS